MPHWKHNQPIGGIFIASIANWQKTRFVHITYNVKEIDRILEPIRKEHPDVVYYFSHNGKNRDINQEFIEINTSAIKKYLPHCEIKQRQVDYVDYYDIIAKLADIINIEKKNAKEEQKIPQFTINLGTGSKMVAIANIDAHRLWDAVAVIYPYSLEYDPQSPGPTHSGEIIEAAPPRFKFEKPKVLLIQAMQILYWLLMHDPHGRQRDFILQHDWEHAIFEQHKILKVKNNEQARRKDSSQKMQLNRTIIGPLEDKWKFITRQKIGKTYQVSFTENGARMARVFMNMDYELKFAPS